MGAIKNKQIPAEHVLHGIYEGFKYSMRGTFYADLTVEDVCNNFPYFRFYKDGFCFAKSPDSPPWQMVYLYAYKITPDAVLPPSIKISTYHRVIPFIRIKKDTFAQWISDWFPSNQLYELFPTREKIINELLKSI